MKTKKLKLSLDKLTVNKENLLNLSEGEMGGIMGGGVPNTSGCHQSLAGPGTCSFATNCYSICQPDCGPGATMACTMDMECNTAFCPWTTDCNPPQV